MAGKRRCGRAPHLAVAARREERNEMKEEKSGESAGWVNPSGSPDRSGSKLLNERAGRHAALLQRAGADGLGVRNNSGGQIQVSSSGTLEGSGFHQGGAMVL